MSWEVFIFVFVAVVYSFPMNMLRKIAESNHFDDFEKYLPRYDDVPDYISPSNSLENEIMFQKPNQENGLTEHKHLSPNLEENPMTTDASQLIYDKINVSSELPIISLTSPMPLPETSTSPMPLPETVSTNSSTSKELPFLPVNGTETNQSNRLPRQEIDETEGDDPEFKVKEKESQENDSEEDENMITGLLGALLGGLSRPDGSIDLEAILGLLGSLSMQNPDGTFDFQGITDLLRGFFVGGDEGGGGSDIGAFTGGLLGAVIKGVANPPGAKGAGILTGKIVTGILPALSGPADDMKNNKTLIQSLDPVGFVLGFLKPVLNSSSGGMEQGGGGVKKIGFFQQILSVIKSFFSASSKSS